MVLLCVDIGATNALIGVGEDRFDHISRVKSNIFLQDTERYLEETLEKSGLREERVDSVMAAVAGPVDRERGVYYPSNMEVEEAPIEERLQRFGEVSFMNDCAAAVKGEHRYGNHGTEHLVYLTISSGIGAGVVMDGEVQEGSKGNFGEVGHIHVSDSSLGTGGSNRWEKICSGNHLHRYAENLTGKSFSDAREVFDRFEGGDKSAERVIEGMKKANARGFASVVSAYNPEKIVVGGAVAINHPEHVVEPLERMVSEMTPNTTPPIEVAELGEMSVLDGLRAYSRD